MEQRIDLMAHFLRLRRNVEEPVAPRKRYGVHAGQFQTSPALWLERQGLI